MAERKHTVSVVVEGKTIGPWEEYEIHSSMIHPADAWHLKMAYSAAAWNALPRDADVRVLIDDTVIVRGFIDRRRCSRRDGELEIQGRDRAGRVVQESAPSINYDGLAVVDAVSRLVDPWFDETVVSDELNRRVRRGKGRRVPTGTEPITIRIPAARGRVHPGMTRWAVIEEITSQAGLVAYSSADGTEFFVGKPNYSQAAQYLIAHPRPGSATKGTCIDLSHEEDNGDRYSVISVVGAGGATEQDYGANVSSRRAAVFDNPANKVDGTGRDFIYPKRLLMPERDFDSNQDAARIAALEQARRDFRRTVVTAEMEMHGQFVGTAAPTIFAPNTIARVIDEEFDPVLDAPYLIVSCIFRGTRTGAETTQLELVPKGTQIVL